MLSGKFCSSLSSDMLPLLFRKDGQTKDTSGHYWQEHESVLLQLLLYCVNEHIQRNDHIS